MTIALAALAALLVISQAASVAAFLVSRDRDQQRHDARERAWVEERRELNQRIQAPAQAAADYAPNEPPEGPLYVPFDDDAAFEEARKQLNGDR